jgi:hypothetical protein
MLLASVPSFAQPDSNAPYGDKGVSIQVEALQKFIAAMKNDPCNENHQFNHFELMTEAVPLYAPAGHVQGAPPRSVILTMDRCESEDRDHVEGNPITPTARRWYMSGSFGVILTTELGATKTMVTVISKMNGSWTTAGQMGSFSNMGLFDTLDEAKAAVKFAHYEQNGVELPYLVHLAFRPSWNR